MLDDEMVDALYEKHEHNVVRLTQNKREAADTANKDRHARAGKFLSDWIGSSVLVRDGVDSIYIYRQQFSAPGEDGKPVDRERIGVCVLLKLVGLDEGIVLPHEYTLSGPKQDRYEQMEATLANTGQIFGLASDDDEKFYKLIRLIMSSSPLVGSFTDENDTVHSLYACSDVDLINQARDLMNTRTVLIADGHHRYETALRFYRERGDEAFSHVMMTIVSMADPGLIIRPFHRLVRKTDQGRSVGGMLDELAKYFDVKRIGKASADGVYKALSSQGDAEMVYWDCASGDIYDLRLNDGGEKFLAEVMPEQSNDWKHLDVSKINCIIINGILSLPLDGQVLHDIVHYANDAALGAEKLTEAEAGYYYGGFFIRPVSIGVVSDTVKGGERMPQKSTNFYPKLYSGLVLNKMR
jgi:uncharacterized protein (DUF1015 family)